MAEILSTSVKAVPNRKSLPRVEIESNGRLQLHLRLQIATYLSGLVAKLGTKLFSAHLMGSKGRGASSGCICKFVAVDCEMGYF